MKSLYIIGNGFDIHHGIKSHYSDYREWLKEYDFDLYDKLCRLYDSIDEDDGWWNSFEQHLSAISFDYINKMYQDYSPIYGSEDFRDADYHRASIQVGLDIDIDNLIENIRKRHIDKYPPSEPMIEYIISVTKTNGDIVDFCLVNIYGEIS